MEVGQKLGSLNTLAAKIGVAKIRAKDGVFIKFEKMRLWFFYNMHAATFTIRPGDQLVTPHKNPSYERAVQET